VIGTLLSVEVKPSAEVDSRAILSSFRLSFVFKTII